MTLRGLLSLAVRADRTRGECGPPRLRTHSCRPTPAPCPTPAPPRTPAPRRTASQAVVVSPTAEAQLAMWGEAVEAMGASIVKVRNSFALNDGTSALPPNGYGVQAIVVTHVFQPRKAVSSGAAVA